MLLVLNLTVSRTVTPIVTIVLPKYVRNDITSNIWFIGTFN